jgi:carboxyl-terminal processing protease
LGIRGLVLDLRSNPGGLLDQAVEVSDLFLDNGQLITYTKGRRSNANNRFLDGSDSRHNGYPLIVLVDQHSASASEIVSGAIQDWDRGLVVGKTTFGKGSVQSVIPLDSETGLKLTTAKYYTPSGRCIHRDEDLGGEGGELARAEGSAAETELAKGEIYHTNTGRPVLGGGGITPDIEIDQRKMVSLESKIERRGYFFTFAVEYSPYHEIPADWEVADSTLALFKTFLEEREIEFTEEEWTEGLPYVRNGIKREIFRKAFGDQAAYEVLIGTDEQLQKTFELFGEAETQDQLFALSEQRRAEKLSEEALASEGDGLADSLAVSSGVVRE